MITKIAVVSYNPNVDLVDACIGEGRSMISAVLRKLFKAVMRGQDEL